MATRCLRRRRWRRRWPKRRRSVDGVGVECSCRAPTCRELPGLPSGAHLKKISSYVPTASEQGMRGRSLKEKGWRTSFFSSSSPSSLFSSLPHLRRRKKKENRSTPPRSRSWPSTGSPPLSRRPSPQRQQPRYHVGPCLRGSTSKGGLTLARTNRSWLRSRQRRPLLLLRRRQPLLLRPSLRRRLLRGCSRRWPRTRSRLRGGLEGRPSPEPRRSSLAEGSR